MRRESVALAYWRLGFAEAVAYRAALLVWILTTTFPLVSLVLWAGIARSGGPIGEFGEAEFVAYFVAAFLVRQLTASWVVWDLERSIRRGDLSVLLLRPVHPIFHHVMLNVTALPVRLVIALVGAWLLNFAVQAIVGCLAFWTDRSSSLYEIWAGLFMVLSGYAVPTSLFPGWLAEVARALPFHAILGFPTEVLTGRLEFGAALEFLALQWAWVAAAWLGVAAAWRRGVRAYGAYGA